MVNNPTSVIRTRPREEHIVAAKSLPRNLLSRFAIQHIKSVQSVEPRVYRREIPRTKREHLLAPSRPIYPINIQTSRPMHVGLTASNDNVDLQVYCGRILGRKFIHLNVDEEAVNTGLFSKNDDFISKDDTTEVTGKVSGVKNPYVALYDALLYPPADDLVRDTLNLPAELWPYQRVGVKFLYERKNALLADDMGLGKTVQALVALEGLFCSDRAQRALVICPKAVLENWKAEAQKWVKRTAFPMTMASEARKIHWKHRFGLLLATPQTVARDSELLADCFFDVLIADDVTLLKNDSLTARAIRKVNRRTTWCLNGSPLENKAEDLVNVMDFAAPGLFSSLQRQYAPGPAEMQQRIKPFFLRRLKKDVLPNLPPKRRMAPFVVELTGAQRTAYRNAESSEWEEVAKQEALTKIHIFATINRLLRLCNLDAATQSSSKADVLEEQLERLLRTEDAKVLLFSQWIDTLTFLESRLKSFDPKVYHGGMSDGQREAVLNNFRSGKGRLLMLSRAGMRGLNLQQACYVFHFDQTWNPHDSWQAEDRAWRLNGHPRGVDVYRFLAKNTIEERIEEVLQHKRDLFYRYVESMGCPPDEDFESKITMDELMLILQPRREKSGGA